MTAPTAPRRRSRTPPRSREHLDDGEVFVVSAFEFTIGYVPMGMTDSPLMMSAEYDQHVDLVRGFGDQQVAEA